MPYIKGVIERIQATLKHNNVSVYRTKSNALRKILSKLKDKRELGDKKNIVYSIPCSVGN